MAADNPSSTEPQPAEAALAPKLGYFTPLGALPGQVGCWRQGNKLVTGRDAYLPSYCIKCGQPVEGFPIRRKISWHPPLLTLLILINLILYAILALCFTKRMTISFYLCSAHRSRRRKFIAIAWFAALASIGLVIYDLLTQRSPGVLVLVGGILLLASVLFGFFTTRTLTAVKIDRHLAYLRGACPQFLSLLPSC